MTKVSRIPVDPKKMRTMHDAFCAAMGMLRTRATTEEFIHGMLTITERKMLAKRLAVARMLLGGASYEKIRREVCITNNTIAHVQALLATRSDTFRDFLKSVKA